MFQEIILYDWRHICQHCYVANRSITSWLVYLAARLAATILNVVLVPVSILFYPLNNRKVVILYYLASVVGHTHRALILHRGTYVIFCCVANGIPSCQKSKSGGLYHLARSRIFCLYCIRYNPTHLYGIQHCQNISKITTLSEPF